MFFLRRLESDRKLYFEVIDAEEIYCQFTTFCLEMCSLCLMCLHIPVFRLFSVTAASNFID